MGRERSGRFGIFFLEVELIGLMMVGGVRKGGWWGYLLR